LLFILIVDWWRSFELYICLIGVWYFETSLLLELMYLRSACTLICIKVRRRLSKLDQIIIDNHGTLSESKPLQRQSTQGNMLLHPRGLARIKKSGRIPATVPRLSNILFSCNSIINLFLYPNVPTNLNMFYTINEQYSKSCRNPCLQKMKLKFNLPTTILAIIGSKHKARNWNKYPSVCVKGEGGIFYRRIEVCPTFSPPPPPSMQSTYTKARDLLYSQRAFFMIFGEGYPPPLFSTMCLTFDIAYKRELLQLVTFFLFLSLFFLSFFFPQENNFFAEIN
jgi:hypothetical protein